MNKTFIYVKLSPKGLFYLGKTEKDPFLYLGSGLIWKKHLKKNNYTFDDIETFILHETTNKEDLIKMGEYYSKLFNVVESKKWANLKIENGDGGDTSKCKNWKPFPIIRGDKHWTKKPESKLFLSNRFMGEKNPTKRSDVKEKIRKKAIGRKASVETKQKMSENRKGDKNGFFNKKHNDITKKTMQERAHGKYTLLWFIKKYGDILGKEKYNEKHERDLNNLEKAKITPRKDYICPHCNLQGRGGNMKRYHFDKCQKK
jgi:hypothetical protein